jgi:hypothetical protein
MRVRIQIAVTASLLLAVTACFAAAAAVENEDALRARFAEPPLDARPDTLWYWMNGNVSADGITRDLEAMHDIGLRRAVIFDGGIDAPQGPAGYLGREWRALMRHAIEEAHRLGLELAVHNAPGWSSSGGPWITPALSMQQLVWTETVVEGGGAIDVALRRPHAKFDYYEDALVVAFPSQPGEEQPFRAAIHGARSGETGIDAGKLTDANPNTSVPASPRSGIVLDFGERFQARALTVALAAPYSPQTMRLEASSDGRNWRPVAAVAIPYPRAIETPGVLSFDAVRARYYRLIPNADADVAELYLHGAPRLEDWTFKAEFGYQLDAARQRAPKSLHADTAIDPARVRDLTAFMDADGRLRWDAPPGSWTILRFGHTTTGKHNIAASAAGHGLEVDKLSAAAADFHFDHGPGQIIELAGPLAGETLAALMIDSYEADFQNWTAALPADFETRNGYGIMPWMAALTGRIVGDAGRSERFLFDFRRTLAALMTENYYARLQARTNDHGMELLVEGYGPGMFDELTVSGRADVPMTEFWARTPWTDNRTVKMVASAAHVYGKQVVAAEAFTAEAQTGRWQGHPYAYKTLGDLMFSLGYNHTVFHRYAHQQHPTAAPGMVMGPWGMNFERTNTWFSRARPWMDYLSRSQLMLRQGRFVADVLYFVGDDTPDGAQYVRPNVSPEASPRIATYDSPAMPAGYDFDLVNADVLINHARVVDGAIVLDSGTSYRVLVIPDDADTMTSELAVRLHELVREGMMLLAPRPAVSLGLRKPAEAGPAFDEIVAELWGDGPVPPGGRSVGNGRVYSNVPIQRVLDAANVPPDVTCIHERVDGQVAWLHRAAGERDIYFIANRQRRQEDVICSFRIGGRAPSLWRARDGSITGAAVYAEDDGRTRVDLALAPAESVFVVFDGAVAAEDPVTWAEHDGTRFADAALPAPPKTAAPAGTFTVSVWAKPEVELRVMPEESTTGFANETGKSWVLPARAGDELYGAGHAAMALAVGRNGALVLERSGTSAPAVLAAHAPIAGWTHFAVAYDEGTPSLYIDGKHAGTGLKSASIVHPGGAAAPAPVGVTYFFEGDNSEPEIHERALAASEISELADRGPPAPPLAARPAELWRDENGGLHALAWQPGNYRVSSGARFAAAPPPPIEIHGPWRVSFRADLGAPESITLDRLASLSANGIPGVRYFSGTATYTVRIGAPELAAGERAFLDLGRVEVIAEVRLNKVDVGRAWLPPYRVEVTDALRAGVNELEIDVTTTWTNRLIGDAGLPSPYRFKRIDGAWVAHDPGPAADGTERVLVAQMIEALPDWYRAGEPAPESGRVTFSTGRFYAADEPLVEAGLLGPVRLIVAEHHVLE